MYVKLVVGATTINVWEAIRDVCRLVTAATPSLASLSGFGFSTTSSVVIDNTPAGWTYIGSSNPADRPSIAASGSTPTTGLINGLPYSMAVSAPCLEGTNLKIAMLTYPYAPTTMTTTSNGSFLLLNAASYNGSTGVATNPAAFYYSASTAQYVERWGVFNSANSVVHLIANSRHITLITEGVGMNALWECGMTDVNRFYQKAPYVVYCHGTTNNNFGTPPNITVPTSMGTTVNSGKASYVNMSNIYDVSTGTFYGNYDPTIFGDRNYPNLWQQNNNYRQNSITSTGSSLYNVQPLFVQVGVYGYPTQAISEVSPVYVTKGSIGTTGDTIIVGSNSYTWFNCGTGFGLALQTS